MRSVAVFLLAAAPACAQVTNVSALVAKVQDAWKANQERATHWSWTTSETRSVRDAAGREIQHLPDVTVESAVRSDGSRCNAVLSWGDGMPPYKVNEDADVRCGSPDPNAAPLRIDALLKSSKITIAERSPARIVLAIHHDRKLVGNPQTEVSCTASVEATLQIDPATYFPARMEGKLVDSGCEGEAKPELHYGETPLTGRSRRMLHKGTMFRVDYEFQQDKFGKPENSYWIATAQQWSRPLVNGASFMVYFNRSFRLEPKVKDRAVLQISKTTAKEFGVESQTRFDTIAK
jgi:hypothetical protein